jgi:hypothetical protein
MPGADAQQNLIKEKKDNPKGEKVIIRKTNSKQPVAMNSCTLVVRDGTIHPNKRD